MKLNCMWCIFKCYHQHPLIFSKCIVNHIVIVLVVYRTQFYISSTTTTYIHTKHTNTPRDLSIIQYILIDKLPKVTYFLHRIIVSLSIFKTLIFSLQQPLIMQYKLSTVEPLRPNFFFIITSFLLESGPLIERFYCN